MFLDPFCMLWNLMHKVLIKKYYGKQSTLIPEPILKGQMLELKWFHNPNLGLLGGCEWLLQNISFGNTLVYFRSFWRNHCEFNGKQHVFLEMHNEKLPLWIPGKKLCKKNIIRFAVTIMNSRKNTIGFRVIIVNGFQGIHSGFSILGHHNGFLKTHIMFLYFHCVFSISESVLSVVCSELPMMCSYNYLRDKDNEMMVWSQHKNINREAWGHCMKHDVVREAQVELPQKNGTNRTRETNVHGKSE